MRRVLSPILVAGGLAGLSLGLIGAGLTVGASPALAAGKKVCTVTDERLIELSGMIATESGYIVINDSSDSEAGERVFLLDKKCAVTEAVRYGGNGPRDPEDLALSADGKTVWIADTGDNVTSTERRTSVVLWSMPVNGSSRPVLHRLTYPGGKPHDVEALLMGDDGTPYLITKSTGAAEIYRPTAALKKNNAEGVPMEKAGELTLPKTTTANTFGPTGRVTITGAARSPDGARIALRTYADAFEWDLVDGDIVKTLTTGEPRATALADPFGEAIAYTPDGKTFLTVSDVGSLGEDATVEILSYPPAAQPAPEAAAGADADAAEETGRSWLDGLSLDDITYLIAGVGLLGAALVGAGVFGILRARRRPPRDEESPDPDSPDADRPIAAARATPYARDDSGWRPASGHPPGEPGPDYDPPPARRPGGVYGGKSAAPSGGAVYGGANGAPARKPAGGAVYGGGPQAGGGPQGAGYGGPAKGSSYRGGRPPGGGYDGDEPKGGGYRGGPAKGHAGGAAPGGRYGGSPGDGYGGGGPQAAGAGGGAPKAGGVYGGSRGGGGSRDGGGGFRDDDGPMTGDGYRRGGRPADEWDDRRGRTRAGYSDRGGGYPDNDYGYR
ncbi:hypothetical protein O7627_10585 [Solwaraspora sp. WMMD1047]|uniref:hypothetical protein n=1 Tax=Solwaraspora sp. WMMD1047 TaxID=3016102 RepID=UPI0024168DCA|nr:hypothetical protein [Solwaraspora sp. WMMD1047]MDG4829747.1 hypothetical protein [Solwaraspora sp. WMMD1047]